MTKLCAVAALVLGFEMPALTARFARHLVRRVFQRRRIVTMTVLIPLIAAASFASTSRATTFDANNSDLWWVPSESGWGIQFVQQADVIFATMFVYDQARAPIWYTATLANTGEFVYSGELYLTSGAWFGGTFDLATVTKRAVGTMTLNVPYVSQASLTYTVDGASVEKSIVRQTLRFENFSGNYVGALEIVAGRCANPVNNVQAEAFSLITINHSGTSFSASTTAISSGPSCSFTGNYLQDGHMGTVLGSYSCNNGDSGNMQLVEMEVSRGGFTSRLSGSSNNCASVYGRLGGVVRRPEF